MIVERAAQSCASRIGLPQRSVDDRDLVRDATTCSAMTFEALDLPFDIPQLRGIPRTAPYFHNHSAATLEDGLTFYQAFFARREVLAPTSTFINAPFRPFSPQEKPALLLPAETLS
jgi:hypothetical protein